MMKRKLFDFIMNYGALFDECLCLTEACLVENVLRKYQQVISEKE
jgi:hypothetical protein